MRFVLIDDDELYFEEANKILGEYISHLEYYPSFDLYEKTVTDDSLCILFLDIELKNQDGIELASSIRKNYPHTYIFFLTNHSELIEQSFGTNIIGFLFKQKLQDKKSYILSKINEVQYSKESVLFKTKHSTLILEQENIIMIEKINRQIFVHTKNNLYRITTYELSKIYSQLNQSCFVYISRSCIINLNYIEEITKDKIFPKCKIKYIDKWQEISKSKYNSLRTILNKK